MLALPGQLVLYGDFNCPAAGRNAAVDGRLLELLESRGLVQRVDQPTHQDGNILDLLIDDDCPGIIGNVRVVDPGLSDHLLVMSDVSIGCPKPQLQRFSHRDFRAVDPEVFATHLHMTDVYMNQADDVDEFYRQIESSVTSVLDALAPLRNRTMRRGKRSSRWLSEKAVTAKRTRRQLERRWKRTGAESDRMASGAPVASPTPRSTLRGANSTPNN